MHDQWLLSCHLSNRHFPLMSFWDPSKGNVVSHIIHIKPNYARLLFQLLLLLSILAFVFSCSVCPHWCHLHHSAPTNLCLSCLQNSIVSLWNVLAEKTLLKLYMSLWNTLAEKTPLPIFLGGNYYWLQAVFGSINYTKRNQNHQVTFSIEDIL